MTDVLIVEDDKLLGQAIHDTLTEGGLSVVWVQSGEEALKQITELKPRMVYMDIMLPGMDGYQVLWQMKNDLKLQDTRVVMLTNMGQIEDMDKAKQLGAHDYIIKANIDLAQLVEITKGKYLAMN